MGNEYIIDMIVNKKRRPTTINYPVCFGNMLSGELILGYFVNAPPYYVPLMVGNLFGKSFL